MDDNLQKQSHNLINDNLVGQDKPISDSIEVGDISHAIATAIGRNASATVVYHPVAPPTPHQIPRTPDDFIGREIELADLLAAIEDRGVTISSLHGLGGVGKTVLALKLAEKLTPRYPDAQFYIDLKGVSSKPLTSAEAMTHIVRTIYPTENLSENEMELGGLYRSVLYGKRALLLLDNAKDAAQVKPLIPPASCALLVTSRQHFTLPGIYAKNLDTLPSADARLLLLKIAPRIGTHAENIADLCGYLPLALRLAGSLLAERVDLTPMEYIRLLQKAKARLDLIEASLNLSYELLTLNQQRLWRTLAVFPDSFDRETAAAVLQIDPDYARNVLSDLLTYSLVEWNPDTGRYWLHDLVRLFADSRLDRTEREAALDRHIWYMARDFIESRMDKVMYES